MRIQRLPSDGSELPQLKACELSPEVLDRAVTGLGWTSVICAATSVMFTSIQYCLQPEFAAAWSHPVLWLTSMGVLLLSLGLVLVQRSGWLSKRQLLDLGMVVQVAVAFAAGLIEGALYRPHDTVVVGMTGISVWLMLCGRMMPKPPLQSAVTCFLCVMMWPFAYWVDLQIFGYERMQFERMLVWILPLCVIAVWTHAVNNRTLRLYMQQQRAEELGSYVLTHLIDRGGMGEVWLAKHRTLARDAALKLIRPEVLQANSGRREEALRKRFEREARATASLRCPHTVAIYDFGQAKGGSFYYVMELIDGIDLQTLVERFGPLHPGRVVRILCQVSLSLEEAHRKGLVHRDIKPRNILLSRLGLEYDFTKVLDFGLVKSLRQEDEDSTATVDGTALGTPAYLAPEAALGSRTLDGRADLYSLGCTAYFLLTGRTVFDAHTPTACAIAHVSTRPQPMSERTEIAIPPELESLTMQLLEKQPAMRIPSAQELRRRLLELGDACAWSSEEAEQWWHTHLPSPPSGSYVPASSLETETLDVVCA